MPETRTHTYGTAAHPGPRPRRSLAKDALLTGLIGAAAVALTFLVVDLVKGQPWFTPAALGSAIFLGARRVSEVVISPGIIAGYTIVHVAVFLLTGFIAVRLMRSAEGDPRAWLGIVLLFVVSMVFFLGMLAIMASWLLRALSLPTVAIAHALAGLSMGAYLWRAHPMMREDLRANVEEAQ